jgi:cardiolipin synthase
MKTKVARWRAISQDKRWLTISNGLTMLRLLLTPFIVMYLYWQQWTIAFSLFVFAAATDLLDGHVARLRNEQTNLGTLLDPIADKFLLVASFGSLAFFHSPFFHIPSWFFVIVLCREAIILIGAIILLGWYKDAHVEPMIWGKITTLLQILFLMWIFICYFMGWEPQKTYLILLFSLALFSLLSLWKYAMRAFCEARS